jgi:hypothetical protein
MNEWMVCVCVWEPSSTRSDTTLTILTFSHDDYVTPFRLLKNKNQAVLLVKNQAEPSSSLLVKNQAVLLVKNQAEPSSSACEKPSRTKQFAACEKPSSSEESSLMKNQAVLKNPHL